MQSTEGTRKNPSFPSGGHSSPQSLQSGRTLSSLLLEHEVERWREVFLTLKAAFQNSRLARGPAMIQELWQKTRAGELGRLVLTLAKEVETAAAGYMD